MSGPELKDVFDNVRLPIFETTQRHSLANRNSTGVAETGRMYWNCFPVVSGKKESSLNIWLESREQLNLNGTSTAIDTILGAVNSTAKSFLMMTQLNDWGVAAIFDGTNGKYVIVGINFAAGTAVKIGELTGAGVSDEVFLTELTVAAVPNIGIVYHTQNSSNSKAYFAATTAGAFTAASLTQIVDVDFPTQKGTPEPLTGPMVQMNGTTYVVTKAGTIYCSDVNSITSWNAAGIIQTNQYPNEAIGLARYKNYIAAICEDSIQFFFDAGLPPPQTTLQRNDQAAIKFGCLHARCFTVANDTLYWIARSSNEAIMGLYKLDNFKPTELTGPQEQAAMTLSASLFLSSAHNLRVGTFVMNGAPHLMIGLDNNLVNFGMAHGATFSGDTNTLVEADLKSGQMCMTLEEEQFWYFHSAIGDIFLLGAPRFPQSQHGANKSFVMAGYISTTSAAKLGAEIMTLDNLMKGSQMSCFDSTAFVGSGSFPYAVAAQLSAKDFGNTYKKRISALILQQRGFTPSSTAATLWLLWNKNDNAADTNAADPLPNMGLNKKAITIPTTSWRYYAKNLGAGRSWTFGFVAKGADHFAVEGFEVAASQSTL
jgi:hypothetical protein